MTDISTIAGETQAEDIFYRVESATERKHVEEILDAIEDNEITSEDDDEKIHEACDSLVDIYNSDLHEWIGGHVSHVGFIEEAMESGIADTSDFWRTVQAGQFEYYRRLMSETLEVLTELAVERGVKFTATYTESGEVVSLPVFEAAIEDWVYTYELERDDDADTFTLKGADEDEVNLVSGYYEDTDGNEFEIEEV